MFFPHALWTWMTLPMVSKGFNGKKDSFLMSQEQVLLLQMFGVKHKHLLALASMLLSFWMKMQSFRKLPQMLSLTLAGCWPQMLSKAMMMNCFLYLLTRTQAWFSSKNLLMTGWLPMR